VPQQCLQAPEPGWRNPDDDSGASRRCMGSWIVFCRQLGAPAESRAATGIGGVVVMGVPQAAVGAAAIGVVELIGCVAGGYALVMAGTAVSAGVQWYRQSRRGQGSRPGPTAVTGRHVTTGGER
jgi:hypothetical protein